MYERERCKWVIKYTTRASGERPIVRERRSFLANGRLRRAAAVAYEPSISIAKEMCCPQHSIVGSLKVSGLVLVPGSLSLSLNSVLCMLGNFAYLQRHPSGRDIRPHYHFAKACRVTSRDFERSMNEAQVISLSVSIQH